MSKKLKKPKSAKVAKRTTAKKPKQTISLPQARILSILRPKSGGKNPILSRIKIIKEAGFSPLSGTFSRALNGVAKMSTVAEFIGAKKGLVDLGFVKLVDTNVDGAVEHGYEATKDGLKELDKFLKTCVDGELPKHRDRTVCLNNRYIKGTDKAERTRQKARVKAKVKRIKKKKLAKQKVKVEKVKKGPVEVVVNAGAATTV